MIDSELSLEPVNGTGLVNGHRLDIVDQQARWSCSPLKLAAKTSTGARSARSSFRNFTLANGTEAVIEATADPALPMLRQSRTTVASATASAKRDLVAQA